MPMVLPQAISPEHREQELLDGFRCLCPCQPTRNPLPHAPLEAPASSRVCSCHTLSAKKTPKAKVGC